MAKPCEVEESVLFRGEYGSFDSPSTSLRVAQDDTLLGFVGNRVNNNLPFLWLLGDGGNGATESIAGGHTGAAAARQQTTAKIGFCGRVVKFT